MFKILLFFTCLIFFWSCQKKDVIYEIPVVSIEEDISIATKDTIWELCFPNQNLGFASVHSNYIYRTENGGKSWAKVSMNIPEEYSVKNLHFFNDSIGLCSAGWLYRTIDGGINWTRLENNPDLYYKAYPTEILGITQEGIVMTGFCDSRDCELYISTDSAKTFTQEHFRFCYSGCEQNISLSEMSKEGIFLMALNDDNESTMMYLNLSNYQLSSKGIYNKGLAESEPCHDNTNIRDTYYDTVEDKLFGVGTCGFLGTATVGYGGITSRFEGHAYDFYGVDGYKETGLVVAVGAHTIVSNKYIYDGFEWNDYYLKPGDSFENTFTAVKVLNNESFIVSGANGMILKMNIP